MGVVVQFGTHQLTLGTEGSVLVGRDPAACQIAQDDPSVSRCHAEIRVHNGQTHIRDLGSSNGTWVDGQRVGNEGLLVLPGQQVLVGRVPLEVSWRDDAFAPVTTPSNEPSMAAAPPDGAALRIALLVIAILGCLGTFLPWGGIGRLMLVSGTDGDGWLTLVAFLITIVIVAAVGAWREPLSVGACAACIVLSLGAAAVGAYDMSGLRLFGSVGSGLYLVTVAGVVIAVVAGFGCRWSWLGVMVLLFVGCVVTAGFVHVVSGNADHKFCEKVMWSLHDTFVDVDDFVGRQVTLENAFAVKGLVECGVLTMKVDPPSSQRENLGPRLPSATYGSCSVDDRFGECVEMTSCRGRSYAGYCPGAENVQCCIE